VSRDEVLRGAAGRAVLAAYRSPCRGPIDEQDRGPVEVQVARGASYGWAVDGSASSTSLRKP